MNNLKEREVIRTDFRDQVLQSFLTINQLAITLVNDWRHSSQNVLSKTNAHGIEDVVTEVDKGIEEQALNIFQEIAPGIDILGEENFKYDFSLTRQPKYFVIDPIDGTKEFVRGSSEWSISLCLVENGEPSVASIYMPDKHSLFTAIKDRGTRYNGNRLLEENYNRLKIGVSPRQIKNEVFKTVINNSGFEPVEVSALTPKISALLRGEINAAVYFPQEGQSAILWDYAAAVLLVHEAGGQITSLCGNELPFAGEEVVHRKGWIATRSSIFHSHLLSCLKI